MRKPCLIMCSMPLLLPFDWKIHRFNWSRKRQCCSSEHSTTKPKSVLKKGEQGGGQQQQQKGTYLSKIGITIATSTFANKHNHSERKQNEFSWSPSYYLSRFNVVDIGSMLSSGWLLFFLLYWIMPLIMFVPFHLCAVKRESIEQNCSFSNDDLCVCVFGMNMHWVQCFLQQCTWYSFIHTNTMITILSTNTKYSVIHPYNFEPSTMTLKSCKFGCFYF